LQLAARSKNTESALSGGLWAAANTHKKTKALARAQAGREIMSRLAKFNSIFFTSSSAPEAGRPKFTSPAKLFEILIGEGNSFVVTARAGQNLVGLGAKKK
jgi:hypothetical protein